MVSAMRSRRAEYSWVYLCLWVSSVGAKRVEASFAPPFASKRNAIRTASTPALVHGTFNGHMTTKAAKCSPSNSMGKSLSNRKQRRGRSRGRKLRPAKCNGVIDPSRRPTTTTQLFQQQQDDTTNDDIGDESASSLDRILDRLTLCFPLFVVLSAVLGFTAPSLLQWVNRGSLITIMLASVMMGTGMTLDKTDFTGIWDRQATSVPAGVLCQYTIMPLSAWWVGRTLLLNSCGTVGPALFLGLVLVGCCPGGTASNLVSLIAKANVALSVLLTACSTILASLVTPLLVKLLVSQPGGTSSTIQVSGMALCSATARVVLLPVILGMTVKTKAPRVSKQLARFTPFGSVLLVALICGGVVANNASTLLSSSSSFGVLLPRIIASVLLLHIIGFGVGYFVPKTALKFSKQTSRTISIETGMQNSALAVVLARSVGAHPLASLPGALSATAHSCLGSFLAAYWRIVDGNQSKEEDQSS